MTLPELTDLLRALAHEEISLTAVHARLRPVLAADPLDVAASDATRWDVAPGEERLFWRLVYMLDCEAQDSAEFRGLAGRVVAALESTGSVEATHELLPLLHDQPRFRGIVEKHARGIISRTGFLSVVAECGYPSHMKLWLEHASSAALVRLTHAMDAGHYDRVLETIAARPD